MAFPGGTALLGNAIGIVGGLLGKKGVYITDSATGNTLLKLDCSIKENHIMPAPPSEFPIESGQVITDNIIIKPAELELTGMISDTPISLVNSLVSTALSAVLPPVGIVAGAGAFALFNALSGASSPSVQAFQNLLGILQNKRPVDVFTSLNRWKSMWLRNISIPRDAQNANVLTFTAQFVQIILVQPQTVNVSKYSNPGVGAGLAGLSKEQSEFSNIVNAAFNNGRVTGTSNANAVSGVSQ